MVSVCSLSARSLSSSPLWGKKINVIGDSYVYNHKESWQFTWHAKIADKYKMTYRNYGKNGNGLVTSSASGVPVVKRYGEMDHDVDYIVVVGGKNDYNKQIPMDEFIEGLRNLCVSLAKDYPGAKICFFTPWCIYPDSSKDPKALKLVDYVNAIIKVCGEYSFPVYDSSRKADVRMYSPEFRSKYCQSPTDVSHLNQQGHLYFMNKAEVFLLSL